MHIVKWRICDLHPVPVVQKRIRDCLAQHANPPLEKEDMTFERLAVLAKSNRLRPCGVSKRAKGCRALQRPDRLAAAPASPEEAFR